mgnify:CR=1 FL=1
MAVYRKHSKGIWSERDTDKKLAITLHVRELLMDYFKDQVEVLQGLRQSHKSISLNLIRYYMQKGDTHMVTVVEDRILTYNPGIERQQLKKEAADTSLTLKQRLQLGYVLHETRQSFGITINTSAWSPIKAT